MYAIVFESCKHISSNLSVINFDPSAQPISAIDKYLTHSHMFCGNDKNTTRPCFFLLSLYTISRLVNLVSIQGRILHLLNLGAVLWIKLFFFQICFKISWSMFITVTWKKIAFSHQCFLYNFISTQQNIRDPVTPFITLLLLLQDKGYNYVFKASRLTQTSTVVTTLPSVNKWLILNKIIRVR